MLERKLASLAFVADVCWGARSSGAIFRLIALTDLIYRSLVVTLVASTS